MLSPGSQTMQTIEDKDRAFEAVQRAVSRPNQTDQRAVYALQAHETIHVRGRQIVLGTPVINGVSRVLPNVGKVIFGECGFMNKARSCAQDRYY
jgi:hypothetical protein